MCGAAGGAGGAGSQSKSQQQMMQQAQSQTKANAQVQQNPNPQQVEGQRDALQADEAQRAQRRKTNAPTGHSQADRVEEGREPQTTRPAFASTLMTGPSAMMAAAATGVRAGIRA